jgi:hypothetical protein
VHYCKQYLGCPPKTFRLDGLMTKSEIVVISAVVLRPANVKNMETLEASNRLFLFLLPAGPAFFHHLLGSSQCQ